MKRVLLPIIFTALILLASGCADPVDDVQETPTPSMQVQETVSPSADEVVPEAVPEEPAHPEWADAYVQRLLNDSQQDEEEAGFGAAHYRLKDLDNDGIPELLFSYLGTVNSATFMGYTYKDGNVELIRFTENEYGWYPDGFVLYRDLRTGGLQWVSHGSFRNGFGSYSQYHAFFDFSDLHAPTSEIFCAFDQYIETEGQGAEYTLYDEEQNGKIVPYERTEEQYAEAMSNYQGVPIQEQFTFTRYLLKEEPETGFDTDKLYAFFDTWDSSIPAPEAHVDPARLAAERRISVEYYSLDTSAPESLLSSYWMQSDLEDIRQKVMQYYIDTKISFTYDEYGVPDELTYCKVYWLSGIDGLFVISGDASYGWPWCILFTYVNGKLELYPDSKIDTNIWGYGSQCEEIVINDNGNFKYPLVELYSYTHRGNGGFIINELTPDGMRSLISGGVMGGHFTTWEEKRTDPTLDGIALPEGESICGWYENGRLAPAYEDVNGDGMIDIILHGAFQILGNSDEYPFPVLASQEVKEVYLYNEQSGEYVYDESYSIQSPLAELWFS